MLPSTSPSLLIVDDDQAVREVLTTLLLDEGFRCESVRDAEMALARVRAGGPDLVITDLKMPGKDGLWLLEQIRLAAPELPVIILTGHGAAESAIRSLRMGAADFLLKPPHLSELVHSIRTSLAERDLDRAKRRYQFDLEEQFDEKSAALSQALRIVERAYAETLAALVSALDAREREADGHSRRVARFAMVIAETMGVEEPDLSAIWRGALLHDIGMIAVPDAVVWKEGALSSEEVEVLRRHPQVGHRILSNVSFLEESAKIVLTHQERWDGSGYPQGLAGAEIPLGARIFSVADTLDAILSDRPHRKARDWASAREEILRHAGTQFDPEVVAAFARLSEEDFSA